MSCIWQWTFSRFCGPHTSNWRASSYSKAVRTAWKGTRHHETSLPKTKKTARNTCRRCRSEATQQTSYEPLQLAAMLTGATNCWLKVGSMLRARSSRSVKRKLRSFPGPVRNDETIRPSDPKRTTKTHPKRPTNIHVLVPRNPSKEY